MKPALAGKSPVTTLNSVVLPAPLEPSTARRSPARTDMVTSARAVKAPKRRPTPKSSSAFAPLSLSRFSTASAMLLVLLTARIVAGRRTDLQEFGFRLTQGLVHTLRD